MNSPRVLSLVIVPLLIQVATSAAAVNALRLRGYSLMPAPQEVTLGPGSVTLNDSWTIVSAVEKEDIAYRSLVQGTSELHGLTFSAAGEKKISLTVTPGAVSGAQDKESAEQAYVLKISADRIEITGNSRTGLFYGVQSLLQLMRRDPAGRLSLPEGTLRDWPDLYLRFVHWDTKHHQNRMETMKRYIDEAAFFKANAISFEMEDKYEYPRHPVIGAPGAYTKAEMQELTRYALERHVQLVPDVQAPAHMNYVLKHPEFAHLKSDSSNYQACMCDEEAIRLILDMYQDMIDATPGVDYFHVSTDEIYYAGICAKCALPYNDKNRSQYWVDYANRVFAWMNERNRKMLCWVEYPLLGSDIKQLPRGLIDAITGPYRSPDWLQAENEAGLPQTAYTSMQGAEFLFPNYFPVQTPSGRTGGRMTDAVMTPRLTRQAGAKNLIASFCAAWDDAGLHDETFWLGWAAVNAYGWNMEGPSEEQAAADFFDAFYGPGCQIDMREIYCLLERQAHFYEDLWDRAPSAERGPGYGYSGGKRPVGREDETLSLPEIPAEGTLAVKASFSGKYADRLSEAESLQPSNERLQYLLTRGLSQVSRNRYNLEVLLSIASLEGYTIGAVLDFQRAEGFLMQAAKASAGGDHARAVNLMVEANNVVAGNLSEQDRMWKELVATWEKSRYPKNRDVGGKKFLHVMDDVKDHFADRRVGLDYMLAPFQRMNIPAWRKALDERIRAYAKAHNVPVSGLAEVRLED